MSKHLIEYIAVNVFVALIVMIYIDTLQYGGAVLIGLHGYYSAKLMNLERRLETQMTNKDKKD